MPKHLADNGFFALRSLGPVQIKGAREPVGVLMGVTGWDDYARSIEA